MDPNTGEIFDHKQMMDLPDDRRAELIFGEKEELERMSKEIVEKQLKGYEPTAPPIIDEAQDLASKTFWNGIPITAKRGTAIVAEAPEFPEYWAQDLVGERIPVVEANLDGANYGGGISYLDNRDGSGWRKVTTGGSPQVGHRDVSIVPGSFEEFDEKEAEELGEILEALSNIQTMPSDRPERYYPVNRAARRAAEKRERKQKPKFVNKPKRKEVRDIGS